MNKWKIKMKVYTSKRDQSRDLDAIAAEYATSKEELNELLQKHRSVVSYPRYFAFFSPSGARIHCGVDTVRRVLSIRRSYGSVLARLEIQITEVQEVQRGRKGQPSFHHLIQRGDGAFMTRGGLWVDKFYNPTVWAFNSEDAAKEVAALLEMRFAHY